MISLPFKKFLFQKFVMTSLHVICGLGTPQSKTLATPMEQPITLLICPKSTVDLNDDLKKIGSVPTHTPNIAFSLSNRFEVK